MRVLKEAEAECMSSCDPAAVLFNLSLWSNPACVGKQRGAFKNEETTVSILRSFKKTKAPWSWSRTQFTSRRCPRWHICSLSVSLCRCVEIIAKEGRSLKELYLVSCKITDHGKMLFVAVDLWCQYHNHVMPTLLIHEPFDFMVCRLWDLKTVKAKVSQSWK